MAEQIVREDVEKLIQAPSACAEVVAAGKRYLEAVGTADEAAAREALVGELKEDVCSIDDLIAEDVRAAAVAQERARMAALEALKNGNPAVDGIVEAAKANGEPNCLCDACQAGARILREAGEA